MRATRSASVLGAWAVGAGLIWGAVATAAEPTPDRSKDKDVIAAGREIFLREWLPKDPRSHGGDGLGPVYNDSSCVACHNAGAPGGAGPASKNIDILSAAQALQPMEPGQGKPARPDVAPLLDIHAGFKATRSVVVHRFGTDPNYEAWRSRTLAGVALIGQVQPGGLPERTLVERRTAATLRDTPSEVKVLEFLLSHSQRNPTALFGIGLIDAIPEKVIARAAQQQDQEVKGRPSRLKDGRIGRFGWKGTTASVEDFVLTACAVEVGLEVPGHSQAVVPQAPRYKAKGNDLTADECAALVAFVRDLPAPVHHEPSSKAEADYLAAGRELFATAGCASCHMARLGDVDGLYSDLLLHDLGPELADLGSYDPSDPDDPDDPSDPEDPGVARSISKAPRGAKRQEWRTPPLWGFRDSAPYLHDGRAASLEQAVAMHGGQGADAARKFAALGSKERLQVEAFLKSLVAPTAH
ncbi:MAG TPA: di-heme oxidoredictase family protein [Isosphaeraceae bacterium]|nr:di-heme oxidoredictase family protein [Isosphaeraceae bacterium]